EVALKIATGAQWMDESYMSDPVSMIVLAPVGMKKRRLLHFPGSRIANALTVDTLPSQIDPSSKVKLKSFTETEADHEFASELFTEGLKQGDLMTAAAGIHTIEDSFAHAGTISELGHAHFWHHPDRPYVDEQSIEKYFQMTRAVFKAMVAIRELLPINGKDMQYQAPGAPKPNYEMNAKDLADIYGQLPDVRAAISRKILNDPGFVKFTLNDIFGRAKRADYVGEGYQAYLENFTPGQDSFQAAYNVAKSMPRAMIRADKILADEGRPSLTSDYILSLGGLGEVLSKAIYQLMDSIVPRPLDAYHKFEKEEDGPIWVEEGRIRVANMRTMIYRLYGANVFFVENNTKDQRGFSLEMSKAAAANRVVPRYNANRVELASYTGAEKYKFNHMIFKFLFPKLSEHLKLRPGEIDRMAQLAVAVNDSEASFLARTRAQLGALAVAAKDLLMIFSDIRVRYNLAKQDMVASRITPDPLNKYYTVPSLLQKKVKDGTFAALISYDEVQKLIDRK
ncbi:MAG: hypothetical protein K2P92_08825, partial [Bdellovibrionaceae bacterium]|nr:hypothetical protein [Pseudobdellovibrionaceae bacterium]